MPIILDAMPLRRYSRFYSSIVEEGDPTHESIFLDLKKGLMKFMTSRMAGQLSISVKVEGEDAPEPFFISGSRFFALVNAYAELRFEDTVLVTDDGRFDLGAFRQPGAEDGFPTFKEGLPHSLNIALGSNSPLASAFMTASAFANKDRESPHFGVFIKSGHVLGTDRILFFDTPLESSSTDLDLPLPIWLAISTLPEEHVKVSWGDNRLRIETPDGNLKINAAKNESLDAPDPTDPDFRSVFDHPFTAEVSRKALIDVLSFFDPFLKYAPHGRIKLGTPSETELSFEVIDGVNAVRRIPAVVSPELVGDRTLWFSTKNLIRAISNVGKSERIIIGIDYDAVPIDVRDADSDTHVVVSSMEE